MKNTWLKASLFGLVVAWLTVNPQPAHGQALVAVWGWRNIVAPEIGGPWIAPEVRFRPLGILDGDPIWRRGVTDNQSLIIVNVPDDRARVWVQGQLMQGAGKQRVFLVPPLEPGFNYAYEIRARWGNDPQSVDETRTVPIRVGQEVIVDFSRPALKSVPSATP
jgi:uncharacterized protein (TIGR03000 family)